MALSFLQDTVNTGLVHHGRGMKDTASSDRSDSRGHCDSPTSLIDASNLSPPLSNSHLNNLSSHAFPGLPHPLQFFPGSLAASQTAALLAAASGNPLHLHATLASGTFQHDLFSKWHSSVSPPLTSKPRKVNNNHVTSSTTTVTKRNQANARRRKKEETMEITPMVEPPSPPMSGSPPSGEVSSGKSSGEKDASNRDKVFTCGVCKRSFGYKHVLQNHERTHTGEKPFECVECHKRFTRDHHLKTHMRLHTGEKPYHCTHCDRQFVQVANLRRHLRVHTGERPYGCELCTSRFSDSNQLKAHVLIHKGEKPFGCETCQGRFRRRHHMLHHKCPGNADGKSQKSRNVETPDLDEMEEMEIEEEEEDIRGMMIAHNNNKVEKKSRSRKTQDIRRVVRMPSSIMSNPLQLPSPALVLPVQTEPEDLSMSTGTGSLFAGHLHRSHHSHSSGDSPMSRSPSSEVGEELDDEDDTPATSTSLFLQHRHPKFRHHLQRNGAAPVS